MWKLIVSLVISTLVHALDSEPANVYSTPCRNSTIAAIACCTSFHCDTAEVLKYAGNVLTKGARPTTATDAKNIQDRLADLLETSPDLQAGMATLCQKRAETCIKQCTNAAQGSHDISTMSIWRANKSVCLKAKAKGEAIENRAATPTEDAKYAQSAQAILDSSSNLNATPSPTPNALPSPASAPGTAR